MRLLEFLEAGVQRGIRLHQFINYALDVYSLGQTLQKLKDGRREPKHSTYSVTMTLLMAGVLRVPSLNQLEQLMCTPGFRQLSGFGGKRPAKKPSISADTMAEVLDKLDVETLEAAGVDLVKQAERNKAFRDDTFGVFRCVAIDGWEPFKTTHRHCKACLSRQIRVKVGEDDEGKSIYEKQTQYYHRFVVAMLVAPTMDMVLALEPVRSEDLREDEHAGRHEGELTAALRLIDRLHRDYGRFIDAFAMDALYACGPVFEKLTAYHYGAVITTKRKNAEPYRTAHEVWKTGTPPTEESSDDKTGDTTQFWRQNNIDNLATFSGEVDVLKAVVTRKNGKKSTWAMALLGKARKLPNSTALRVLRARWHIENTAFHQWVKHWDFDHCYRHTPNAIHAVFLIWTLAFNLMQLFFYRRLKKQRHGRPVNDTIIWCVKEFWMALGSLDKPIPWSLLDDTRPAPAPNTG